MSEGNIFIILACTVLFKWGFPYGAVIKNPPAHAGETRKHRFDPWVRTIPWSKKRQPTPVVLPGKFHGQRILKNYSPWSCKGLDMTEYMHVHTHKHAHSFIYWYHKFPMFDNHYIFD